MKKMDNRPTYEPPRARDLSSKSASGQDPMGMCASGSAPYFGCNVGAHFGESCATGSSPDTSECLMGSVHAYDACQPGGFAITACISGTGQQW